MPHITPTSGFAEIVELKRNFLRKALVHDMKVALPYKGRNEGKPVAPWDKSLI